MTPPAPTPEEVELDEIATMLDSVGDEYLNWKRQLFPIARKVQEYVRAREATAHARGREEALEEAAAALDEWGTEMGDVRYHIDQRDWLKCFEDETAAQWLKQGAAAIRALRRPPSPREEGK